MSTATLAMTDAQRRLVLAVIWDDWAQHTFANSNVIATCRDAGWIRCDHDHLPLREARWTVTPDGIEAVEAGE